MKRNRKLTHKHETPADRIARHQHDVQRASGRVHPDGFHGRSWQDGPPLDWMTEHRDFQNATIFKERTDR